MNVYSIYKRQEIAPVGGFRHVEDTIFALIAANSEIEAINFFAHEIVSKNNYCGSKKYLLEEEKKLKKPLIAFKCNTLECNNNNPKFLFYLDSRHDNLIQDDGLNANTYYYERTGGYVSGR